MRSRPAQEVLGLRFDRLSPAAYVALTLALGALWLLGRRYGGFTHDATIYALQGLRVLDPASFAGDLFFLHGAQDSYTVFPRLYALLIGIFGVGNAAMVVTVAGQAAFFAAAAALVVRLPAGLARWWSLALLAALSGYYGGVGVFRLAEPFATARTLAEPLVLAALACTLASRHFAASAMFAAAAVLHPLVAAPGIAAVMLWHAVARPRVLWLIPVFGGLIPAIAIVWPGVALRFDPPWLAAVLERSPHLFVAQWPIADWARLLWGLCVVWLAARFLESPVRRLVVAIAVIGVTGVAASWIAVDQLDNALVAGLQLWRTHWLLHFFAIVLVPVAAAGLWRSGNAARAAAACLAVSCCFGRAELPAAGLLAVLAVILDAAERRWPHRMGETTLRLLLLSIACAASVGLVFEVQSRLPSSYGAMRSSSWTDYVHAAASVGGLLPLAALLWLASWSRFTVFAVCSAAAAFVLSMAAWDARVPWSRFIEEASAHANPFRDAVAPGAVVFWPGPHGRVWLVLGRQSWFSVDQGAGIVFNRATAIEYARRKLASSELQSAIENCAMAGHPACRIDARPGRELCERRDAPDYLVLNARIDGHAAIEWHLPAEIGPDRQSLFLYSCRVLAGTKKAGARPASFNLHLFA
jgi:hypothetical protein